MSSNGKSTTATDGESAPSPKLRFPEFHGANSWRVTKLNSLLFEAKHRNRSLELGAADVLSVSGEYGCVNQIEFMGRSYAGVTVKDYNIVEHNDIVYTKSPLKKNPYGIIKENKGKRGIVSTLYAVYRPTPECCPTYLDHFFSVDFHVNSYLQPIVRKGAKNDMKVNNADVLKGDICVPTLGEQQKIAECLDSADALMAVQRRKVEALKAHKKGLMQQLFPQEGETLPRLRFPEFEKAPSWVPTTIGGLGSFYYGKSAPKWSLAPDAPTRCVRYGELYSTFGPVITETYSRTNIDPATLRFSKGGEILVPRVGEKPEDFGKCCCYLPLANIAIGEMISVFETDQDPLFYTYYFRGLYRQFAKVVEGQNVKNLYYVELEPIPLFRPSIPEQARIAGCLRSLDDLISAETRKLDTLKIHKNALMQQLFPVVGGDDA